MLLNVRATATYELPAETFLALMVEPSLSGSAHRVLQEYLWTSPTSFSDLSRDLYGNVRRHLLAPPGPFSFTFSATIDAAPARPLPPDAIQHPPREIPPEAMIYTLPSRYCQSDLLARMAASEFGHHPTGGAAGRRHRRLGPDARRIPVRDDRQSDVGIRHGDRASRRLPRLRPPRHRLLSQSGYPGALRLRIRPGPRAARLPRLRPGVRRRRLARCRRHLRRHPPGPGPHRLRPRRRRCAHAHILGECPAHRTIRPGRGAASDRTGRPSLNETAPPTCPDGERPS